jgi:hypothetical protein
VTTGAATDRRDGGQRNPADGVEGGSPFIELLLNRKIARSWSADGPGTLEVECSAAAPFNYRPA